jgi:hypothetical protein
MVCCPEDKSASMRSIMDAVRVVATDAFVSDVPGF